MSLNPNNKFWKNAVKIATSGKTSSLLTNLPAQYNGLSTQIAETQQQINDLNQSIEDQLQKDSTSYQSPNTDQLSLNSINTYQTQFNYLQNTDQAKYDTLLHQAYRIGKLNSTPEGYFPNYLTQSIKKKYDDVNSKLTTNHQNKMLIQNTNSSIMDDILKYQEYVIALQSDWLDNSTQQITGQVELMRQLQDRSNTEKRKTSYLQTNLIDYDNYIYWLQLLCLVLIIFIVSVLLYFNVNWSGLFSTVKQSSALFSPVATTIS